MAGDDATIRIGGDAREAVSAIDSVRRALDGVQRAAAAVSVQDRRAADAAKAESATWKQRADNANAWKRASSGIAPQMSGIIDSFEEFAEGSERIGGAAMAARVGVLALGTAWTAAAVATSAAGAAIVGSSVEVITHLDQYSDVASRHRGELVEASQATAGLHREVTELRVEIAGQMAPAIGGMADAMTGLVVVLGDAEMGVYDLTQSVGISAHDIAGYVPLIGDFVRVYDQLAEKGREAQRQAAALAARGARFSMEADAAATGEGRVLLWSGGRINMEAEAAAEVAAQAEADAMMLVSRAHAATAASVRANTAAHVAQAPVVDVAIQQATELAQRQHAQWEILEGLDAAERERAAAIQAQVSAIDNVSRSTLGGTQSMADEAANAAISASERVQASWQQTTASIVGTASSILGTLGSIISEYTDMQVGSMEHADARQRAIMRERFRREKAAAIAMAVIQGALSVVQTLASVPYPLNIVLGIAQAAAVAAEVAVMSRQQPTYHRGGRLAPDEALYGGARVLQRETAAVYSDRRAPSEGDIARAQTGERARPDEAPAPMWSLMIDGVRRTVRRHAGPSAGYSPGRMAYGV